MAIKSLDPVTFYLSVGRVRSVTEIVLKYMFNPATLMNIKRCGSSPFI